MGKKRKEKFKAVIIDPEAEIKNYSAEKTLRSINKKLRDMHIKLENEWNERQKKKHKKKKEILK